MWANQLAADDSSPSEQVMCREEAEMLDMALTRLGEEERRAIFLRHKEQRTFADIGRTMGRSTSGARSLCRRAVARLNQLLNFPAGE